MAVNPIELTVNTSATPFEFPELKVLVSEAKESQELCDEQSWVGNARPMVLLLLKPERKDSTCLIRRP